MNELEKPPPNPPQPFHHPTAVVPFPSSPITPASSPLLSPLRQQDPCETPSQAQQGPIKQNGTKYTGEDIEGRAKRLFWRMGGGPCNGIAVSCRIKEASKIAALNYILADERPQTTGTASACCTRSPGTSGVIPRSKHRVHTGGTPQRWPKQPWLGPVMMGAPGSQFLLMSRQQEACTPAAKVMWSAEADAMFRC